MVRKAKQKSYLTPNEVAELLMVSPTTVRQWASQGKIKSSATPGGHRRFMRTDVDRFSREQGLTMQLPDDLTTRILIVDDDQDILTAIQQAVESIGATCQTAADGNQAVELAEQEKPDLIILDAMLPKRSGFLVMEKLRTSMTPADRPKVIMITGNPGKRHQEWATSLGANAFINKPFRMERLLDAVEKLFTAEG